MSDVVVEWKIHFDICQPFLLLLLSLSSLEPDQKQSKGVPFC